MDEMVVLLIPLLGTTLGAAMVFFMKLMQRLKRLYLVLQQEL